MLLPPLPSIPARIEDYALLSDFNTAALVSRAGSVDWLCWPRFDSAACFAALLGDAGNGRWQIAPTGDTLRIERQYRDGSAVLETVFHTASGSVALIDFMPLNAPNTSLIRLVEGRSGSVELRLCLRLRFDYGDQIPWVCQLEDETGPGIVAIAGPHLVVLRGSVPTHGQDMETMADLTVAQGERLAFVLSHGPSHLPAPKPLDGWAELAATESEWTKWSGRCQTGGEFEAEIKRSLVVLKSLTFAATGGIVAAPTTSLPETLGGSRNWDYRFCWLRDSTFALIALMDAGYYDEAQCWGHWLHRSIAGSARQIQIMYGIDGTRTLTERIIDHLPGYGNSLPVRVGNEAAGQLQLDVFGEVMGTMRQARLGGLDLPPAAWAMQCNLLDHLDTVWRQPDAGMWEVRGGARQFTFSKIMVWLAYHCAILDAEEYGFDGPLDQWRATRDEIHALVCAQGFDAARNSFTQYFGTDRLDASLLLIPLTGFLPPEDPRVIGTVAAIERDLMRDGLVLRYEPEQSLDGQSGAEGAFLACSFWLVGNLELQGRGDEARALFRRVAALANDVGLLAEEYDGQAGRMVGNFPQAFSHLALITSATLLQGRRHRPVANRRE